MSARYGGEEFIILLPYTDHNGGLFIAQNLRQCVENLAIPHAFSLAGSFVTVSVGLATEAPNADHSRESLLRCADEALYLAKNTGRNKVVAYRP